MLHVGAILLDALTEILGDLRVALEQVLARHAGLAGGAARRNDVCGTRQGLLDIRRPGDVHTLEGAVVELLGNTLERRPEGIVEANVRRQTHHQSGLCHVRADHAGCAHDGELFIRYEIHNLFYLNGCPLSFYACSKHAFSSSRLHLRHTPGLPPDHSISRRLSSAWVIVSSSTYSSSSPKPMPRAMEVIFSPGNCLKRFIR